jgi:hypothetical protein
MAALTINYTIPFGSSLRVGYKIVGSLSDYTYVNFYPDYNSSPYIVGGLALGAYEVQLNTVCLNCAGSLFSDPVVIQAVGV